MRIIGSLALVAVLLLARPVTAAGPELRTEDQKTLYTLGVAISRSLETFKLSEAELEAVKDGMTDGVLHRDPKIDLNIYGPRLQAFQQARAAAGAADEKKAGAGVPRQGGGREGRHQDRVRD